MVVCTRNPATDKLYITSIVLKLKI
jgi:hypothetical protein